MRFTIVSSNSCAFVFVYFASAYGFAGTCPVKASKDPAYVWGTGSGHDYQQAKHAAMADLSEFFGVSIEAQATLTDESDSDIHVGSRVDASSQLTASSIEVDSQCVRDGTHHIVVKLGKAKVRSELLARANDRISRLENLSAKPREDGAGSKATSFLTLKGELVIEAQDLKTWMAVGGQRAAFPVVPSKLKSILAEEHPLRSLRIFVEPNNPIGQNSLSAVIVRLQTLGLAASLHQSRTDSDLEWSCRLRKGSTIGTNQRFSCTCELTGGTKAFRPITVRGISEYESLDETVSQQIVDALGKLEFAD